MGADIGKLLVIFGIILVVIGRGKLLVIFGIILVVIGLLLSFKLQIPWLGKLPGDISIKRDNFHFYFPLATSILISILLTAILYFFRK